MTITFKNPNKPPLQIIRIIAESTFATQVELATPPNKGKIIFIQNAQIESITN